MYMENSVPIKQNVEQSIVSKSMQATGKNTIVSIKQNV